MAEWFHIETSQTKSVLSLSGSWRIKNLSRIQGDIKDTTLNNSHSWCLDGSQLAEIDTAGAMLALDLLEKSGLSLDDLELKNFAVEHLSIIRLAGKCVEPPVQLRPTSIFGFVARLGRDFLDFLKTVRAILIFVGETTVELLRAIAQPRLLRFKELAVQLESVGYNAIPIVFLLTFLIGVVIAYLTGVQIEKYGANIFIVDGVSLAMCRELSPILVAVIVAGRSGSAFTAQIGAMKLNEEIDAMHTLGLSPMRVLVVPRLLALMIAMPVLVFIGDIAGILGGMVVADLRLGITGATFIERLRVALWARSVLVGLIKAPVFGLFIATIGCRMGLAVENNARSVGISTTKTVVRCIVAVILLNAVFAVVFSELGI